MANLLGARDLTRGGTMAGMLQISVPLLFGSVAEQLYSTVDAIIIGRFSGQHDQALAAIAVAGSVDGLLMVMFLIVIGSTGVMVSQYYGAKDEAKLRATIGTALALVLISALAVTVPGIALADKLLKFVNTPPEVHNLAREYLSIMLIGTAASGLFNVMCCVLRGVGDAIWPLILLIIAVALNVVLDIWFVIGLGWGVQGAAWASVLAQSASALMCVARLNRLNGTINFRAVRLRIDMTRARELIRLGLPVGISQCALSIGILLIQSLTNRMGQAAVVASMAVSRVDSFAMLPCFAFGQAMTTFAAQNVGAGQLSRVEAGGRDAMKLSLGVALFMGALLMIFGQYFVRWFSDTEQVALIAAEAFSIMAVSYMALGMHQVFGGIIRGSGDMMPMMWITLSAHFLVRVPVAYGIAEMTRSASWPHGSPVALFVALMATRIVSAAASYIWYKRGTWRHKSVVSSAAN